MENLFYVFMNSFVFFISKGNRIKDRPLCTWHLLYTFLANRPTNTKVLQEYRVVHLRRYVSIEPEISQIHVLLFLDVFL
jgi:hypothetical protein